MENHNIFFTADTHFSQERTLELSKRPFQNTYEMDEYIISNWNKVTNNQSIIFHLGDFGNCEILSRLNGKNIYIVPGNYENNEELIKLKNCDDRIFILKQNHLMCLKDHFFVRLVHKPLDSIRDEFTLFGHIHRLSMVKKNGLNVGQDCNYFRLFSIDDVLFQINGIYNHYDKNVFCEL